MSGRIRSLKPEWLEDEPLMACSSDARVLSAALLLLSDDYGNGRAGELYLSSRVFPGRPVEILRAALSELTRMRYTILYEVEGQRYYHVRNWVKHQRVQNPGKPLVPSYSDSPESRNPTNNDPPESQGRPNGEPTETRERPSVDSPTTLPPDGKGDGDGNGDGREREISERAPAPVHTHAQTQTHAREAADPFWASLTTPDDELPATWTPNEANQDLAKRLNLDLTHELGVYRADRKRKQYRCGDWDADFEVWLRRGAKFDRQRAERGKHTNPNRADASNQDWPTEAARRLREAIREGKWGVTLQAKENASQLDYALATRLIRESRQERADRQAERAEGRPVSQAVRSDVGEAEESERGAREASGVISRAEIDSGEPVSAARDGPGIASVGNLESLIASVGRRAP